MTAPRRISFVIPCFNEETRLNIAAFQSARLREHGIDLLFVDDGSTDRTAAILKGLHRDDPERLRILSLERNVGKAEAVRRGVLDALGRSPEAIGFWDADLATPLSEMPAFVNVLAEHPEVGFVIGSRVKLMGRVIERRAWRHYLGRVFATAAAGALDLPVYDTQCGAKLLRVTEGVKRIFETPFLSRWVFDVELIARYVSLDPRGRGDAARSLYELPLLQWIDVG
ncbi:MAG: glycosyltransferase, partial [Polyangiaceae bacterium]